MDSNEKLNIVKVTFSSISKQLHSVMLKGRVVQIEKAQINNHLRVSKVSWKFRIPTIYNFAVIYP